jgi:catechol 2,3-dioxygenase-like lactoylglutathione lyase family enzyme
MSPYEALVRSCSRWTDGSARCQPRPGAHDRAAPASSSAVIVGQVTGPVHLILYVQDQQAATAFWQAILDRPPNLDVPGMTEFSLGTQVVLGLMPEAGIRSLLGPSLPDPAAAHGIPRAEVYLVTDDAAACHARALAAGATELSSLAPRSWGDDVAYSLDPDGHVVAFATRPS